MDSKSFPFSFFFIIIIIIIIIIITNFYNANILEKNRALWRLLPVGFKYMMQKKELCMLAV